MKKFLATILLISSVALFSACDIFDNKLSINLPGKSTPEATLKTEEVITASHEITETVQPTITAMETNSPAITENPPPPSATITVTAAATATATATIAPTPTKTNVITPAPTQKITPSPTPIVTQKPTATPIITPTIKPTAQPTPVPTPQPTPTSNNTNIVTSAMLKEIETGFLSLVNYERSRVGVSKLTTNAHLDSCASTRAKEIITLFSHTRPNGTNCFTVIDDTKYPYSSVGENICMTSHVGNGYVTEFTGSDSQIEAVYSHMFNLFKNSPGHYENMIDGDFEHCGIGISYKMENGIPMFYCAHLFGADNQ